MSVETTTKTERDAAAFSLDGGETWWTYERKVTRVSDIRETAFGLVDFGTVTLGERRLVRLDR